MLNYQTKKSLNILEEIKGYYTSSFKPRHDFKYGLEYERIPVDIQSLKNADYKKVQQIIETFAQIKGWGILYDDKTVIGAMGENSSISLEPGCQFELSLEAKAQLAQIEKSAKEILSLADRIAKFYNIEFLPIGITPKSTYQNIEILNKQRYIIMAKYLPKFGKFAPSMMRETAGVQLNVDYESEDDAILKIKVLNYISPFLTAFFANSPIRNDKITNYKSFRALAWKYTGDDRCKIFYGNVESFDDYINAILKTPMLFFEREGKKIILNGKINFSDFIKNGYEGYSATLEDYILHSSLCFPDIRLKKCIEIRNHDSQNFKITLALCALYKGILNSNLDSIVKDFVDITPDDIDKMGFLAAKHGSDFNYDKFCAKEYIEKLFDIAYRNLSEEEKSYLTPAYEIAKNKKCMADLILENKVNNSSSLVEFLRR